jgi:hypothetical protein
VDRYRVYDTAGLVVRGRFPVGHVVSLVLRAIGTPEAHDALSVMGDDSLPSANYTMVFKRVGHAGRDAESGSKHHAWR